MPQESNGGETTSGAFGPNIHFSDQESIQRRILKVLKYLERKKKRLFKQKFSGDNPPMHETLYPKKRSAAISKPRINGQKFAKAPIKPKRAYVKRGKKEEPIDDLSDIIEDSP